MMKLFQLRLHATDNIKSRPDLISEIKEKLRHILRGSLEGAEGKITLDTKDSPGGAEGKIVLDDVEYWFVCIVQDELIDMHVYERNLAEATLNEHGMSTHEPFNPLPAAKRPN